MKKSLYVKIPATIHLAARQRALTDAKTLAIIVEEALRAFLRIQEVA